MNVWCSKLQPLKMFLQKWCQGTTLSPSYDHKLHINPYTKPKTFYIIQLSLSTVQFFVLKKKKN